MRSKYVVIFIVFFVLIAGDISAQKKEYQINAIAFYNLENLFDTKNDPDKNDEEFLPSGPYHYTDDIYKKKLHNLATVLSQLAVENVPDGPAVIGVAEIENADVLKDLIAEPELKQRGLRIVHFESPDIRGVDVGMLYNPKYFKVLSARSLPVDISNGGHKEYTRDILYVDGMLNGDTIHVMVGHWPSRRGGEAASQWKRAKAAKVCRDIADSITSKDPMAKIVVMGDLNDDPVSPSVAEVLGAVGKESQARPCGFFNPWMNLYKKGIGTLGYNDSWNLFDQIIVSSGFLKPHAGSWKFYKPEIFNRAFLKSQSGQYKGYPHRSFSGNVWIDGYSDHFPTYIYLIREKS